MLHIFPCVYLNNFFFFDKCLILAEVTTKFNKDMYARMRGKKDEPLSAIGIKSVYITDRGVPILAALPSSPTSAPARGVSLTPSVEEVPPRNKRLRAGEKQKEKVDSRLLTSGMMVESLWQELKKPLAQTSLRCSLECQLMTSRGVICTSSCR